MLIFFCLFCKVFIIRYVDIIAQRWDLPILRPFDTPCTQFWLIRNSLKRNASKTLNNLLIKKRKEICRFFTNCKLKWTPYIVSYKYILSEAAIVCESTGKETGKSQLCVLVEWFFVSRGSIFWVKKFNAPINQYDSKLCFSHLSVCFSP